MGNLIVVDCEAPFGVGAPSVGDMTEFGAVDVNALRGGRVETFHGLDCSEDTFRQFRDWLDPTRPPAARALRFCALLSCVASLSLIRLRARYSRAWFDGQF